MRDKSFVMDRQTFVDLEIFESRGVNKSIFKLFNRVITSAGKKELIDMFNYPLSDINKIKERQELIKYVNKEFFPITIDPFLLDFIDFYLLLSDKPTTVSWLNAWHNTFKNWLKPTNEYYLIKRGVGYLIEFLQELYSFIMENSEQNLPDLLKQQFIFITDSIQNTELNRIIGFNTKKKINVLEIERFDYIFRYSEFDRLKKILQILYQIDAFLAVAKTMTELGLVFPEISKSKTIEITGLYHPFVKEAVVNNIWLNEEKNIFFMTGANMAGKSTFLKAFGVAIYLTHLGFPVPATSMHTRIFNGLFSSINVSDNLSQGYSHFYSEVLRVKKVANKINKVGNLVVIFDELFRGTNVKDAFDASLAVISAFSKVKGSIFLVSTHIIEVADQLRKLQNIKFGYFHTAIKGKTPVYSYLLQDGVTEERIGMLIIENERIIEIINADSSVDN